MSRSIEILKGDWERLRRARPELNEEQLRKEILGQGKRRLAEEPEVSVEPGASLQDRLVWLRRWTPRRAAAIATLGFELVKSRSRLDKATHLEETTYQRDIELQKDVLPEVKERAKALRAEVRRLEAEVRARGGDPGTIEPALRNDMIVVDDYQRPEFETNESRRKAVVEFFRRREKYQR